MTETTRRSALTRLLSLPILGAALGLTKVVSLEGKSSPPADTSHRAAGMRILRFLNTLQYWHKESEGTFATMPQLRSGEAFGRLTGSVEAMKKLGLDKRAISAVQFANDAEVVPGWKLTLTIHDQSMAYRISLEDTTGRVGRLTTDDRGVIQVTAGSTKGMLARTGAMIRAAAWVEEDPDCCSDHHCCCACGCEDNWKSGSVNCGCLLCTWCPICPGR